MDYLDSLFGDTPDDPTPRHGHHHGRGHRSVRRPTTGLNLRSLGALGLVWMPVVALLTVEACGGPATQTEVYSWSPVDTGTGTDTEDGSVTTGIGVRLHPHLVDVPSPDTDVDPTTNAAVAARVEAAVEALRDFEPPSGENTLWSDNCAPGNQVTAVEVTSNLITVTMTPNDDNATCDLSEEGVEALRQQVAWTVHTATMGARPRAATMVNIEATSDSETTQTVPVFEEPVEADPAALDAGTTQDLANALSQ